MIQSSTNKTRQCQRTTGNRQALLTSSHRLEHKPSDVNSQENRKERNGCEDNSNRRDLRAIGWRAARGVVSPA